MNKWLKKVLVALCSMTFALSAGALVGCSSCEDFLSLLRPDSSRNELTSEEGSHTHEFGEPVVEAATCTERGSSTVTCETCGQSITTTLLPTGHSYALAQEVEATCTMEGYNEYACSTCGDVYTEITADKTGHDTLEAVWTIVGEEQVDGCQWLQHEKALCGVCNEPVTHAEELYKHEYHVTITEEANCSKEGVKTYACKCGDGYTEDFKNENGHTWVKGNVDTNTGITSWSCSNNCGKTKTSFSAKDMVVATIPATAIQEAKEIELQNATLELPQEVKEQLAGGVELSVDTLDDTAKDKATSNLTDDEKEKLSNTPIFEFSMMQGDNAVTKFEKEITVTVPYTLEEGADPADIAVWYIDDEGKLTSIKATYSIVDGAGFATFTTDHFSYYTVVRLSAKERCALYGCEERVTVVAPTCETDGYTLTKCIRCNATSRSAFVKALGHDYETNTVTPSCTAKGYTTYSCKRAGCKHAYQTNWKDMLAHEYEAKTVAPTCTSKGYTTHTCKGCGDSYVDQYVDAKGHNYQSGVCTTCGKNDPAYVTGDAFNFYFNAIESLLTANSYYLEVTDLQVEYANIYYEVKNSTTVTFETDTMDIVFEKLQLEIGLDETGELIGKGIAKFAQSQENYNGYNNSMSVDAQVVLRNGFIYTYATGTDDGTVMETKCVASVDALLSEMGLSMDMMKGMMESAGEMEDVVAILEGIAKTPDSPLNKVISDVLEYVYTKTETDNGYHFELNFDRADEVYAVLTEKTVDEAVDAVLGEGAYAQVVNYLTSSIDKNVGIVVEDLAAALALCGVDIENVYNLINLASGDEEFEVRTLVEQYATMKVSAFLDNMTGAQAGSVDYKAMITQYSEQLKQTTMMDLIVMLIYAEGNNQGAVKPEGDRPTDETGKPTTDATNKPSTDVEDTTGGAKPMPKRNTEGEYNTMYLMLMKVMETLKKSSFSFDTDKSGEVLRYTVNLVGLGDSGSLQSKLDALEEEALARYETDGRFGSSTSFVKVSGQVLFQPNGSFAGSYDNVVQMGNEVQTIVDKYFQDAKEGKLENVNVYVDVLDGEMWTDFSDWGVKEEDKWEDGKEDYFVGTTDKELNGINGKDDYYFAEVDKELNGIDGKDDYYFTEVDKEQNKAEEEAWVETTYAGQTAWMKKCYGSIRMINRPYSMLTTENDCLDWEYYTVNGTYYGDVYYNLYKNANGEYIGVELFEGGNRQDLTTVASFYYNSTTGKFGTATWYEQGMHNYEIVEQVEAVGCTGKGYTKRVCTNCGDTKISYYSNDHDRARRYVLSEGSVTCEDGVDVVTYCRVCNEELDREERCFNWHESMMEYRVLAHADCGDIWAEFYACACGMHQDMKEPQGTCNFDYVESWELEVSPETGEYTHVDVYRCAVTDCAYTYTRHFYDVQIGCTTYGYTVYRFGAVKGSDECDAEYIVKEHYGTKHRGYHRDESEEDGLYTIHAYCTACNKDIEHYQARYDINDMMIYYKNLMKNAHEEWEAAYELTGRLRQTYYRDLLGNYGWRREYDGCYYVEYDLDGYYICDGDTHEWWWDGYPYSNSCTQYQYEGHYEACRYCDEGEKKGYYTSPSDHNYYFDDNLGLYVCDRCGMKNQTGADDVFVIEDLTGVVSEAYAVGYYNREWVNYNVYVVINYGEHNEAYLDQVSCTDKVTHANSGVITVDMAALRMALGDLGVEGRVSLVIQYFDEYSGAYDPVTGTWEGSYIDCIVTFE